MNIPVGTYFIVEFKTGTNWFTANGGNWIRDENQARDLASRMREDGHEVNLVRFQCERSNIPFGGEQEIRQAMDELAKEYHDRCEEFDKEVCQHQVRGAVMPNTSRELALVNQNARMILEELIERATQKLPMTRDTAKNMLHSTIRRRN